MHNGEVADEWRAIAKKAQAEVARLNEELAIALSFKEGLHAQVKALKQAHPTSPMFSDGGQRYPDGSTKSRIRLIFDQAFDAFAVQCGIKNPASIRDK